MLQKFKDQVPLLCKLESETSWAVLFELLSLNLELPRTKPHIFITACNHRAVLRSSGSPPCTFCCPTNTHLEPASLKSIGQFNSEAARTSPQTEHQTYFHPLLTKKEANIKGSEIFDIC